MKNCCKVLVAVSFTLIVVSLILIFSGCQIVRCPQVMEANDPVYHLEWTQATYHDMEVYQLRDFTYLLRDENGNLFYIECWSVTDMYPTYEVQIDPKTEITRRIRKDKFMDSLGN